MLQFSFPFLFAPRASTSVVLCVYLFPAFAVPLYNSFTGQHGCFTERIKKWKLYLWKLQITYDLWKLQIVCENCNNSFGHLPLRSNTPLKQYCWTKNQYIRRWLNNCGQNLKKVDWKNGSHCPPSTTTTSKAWFPLGATRYSAPGDTRWY